MGLFFCGLVIGGILEGRGRRRSLLKYEVKDVFEEPESVVERRRFVAGGEEYDDATFLVPSEWTRYARLDIATSLVIGAACCAKIDDASYWREAVAVGLFDFALGNALLLSEDMREEARRWKRVVGGGSDSLALFFATAPVVLEEIIFRSPLLLLQQQQLQHWTLLASSALLFGCAHSFDSSRSYRTTSHIIRRALYAGKSGFIYGYVALASGSLVPAIVAHAVHNAAVCASLSNRTTSQHARE